MSSWTTTVPIAVATSFVTTATLALTVGPRLEARNRRIQAAHIARDKFSENVLVVLSACARLQAIQIPSDAAPAVRDALREERRRCREQLDEATAWLADHLHAYALGYVGALGLREMLVDYAAVTRFIFISQRREEDKLSMIEELTGHIQNIFFARLSIRVRQLNVSRRQLRTRLDSFRDTQ